MVIDGFLRPENICTCLAATSAHEVLAELAGILCGTHQELDYTHLVGRLRDRELLGSTGMGEGVAIPHCSQSGIVEPLLAFGRSCEGVPFAALDGRLVNLFILLVTPESEAGLHLKLLARISRLMLDGGVRTRLMEAEDAAHFLAVIREQDLCP